MLLPSHSTSFIPCSGCLVINLGHELFSLGNTLLSCGWRCIFLLILFFSGVHGCHLLYKTNTAAALVKKRGKFATNQVVYLKSAVVILGYLPVLIS